MKVTRYPHRYMIRCSEHEMEILELAIDSIASDAKDVLPTTGLRRSWSRRTNAGRFLRIDKDRRTNNDS